MTVVSSPASHPAPSAPTGAPEGARRPYAPPSLEVLGSVLEFTKGQGGSNFDVGHNNYVKRGMG
jgi:hypothetical protein